MTEAQVIAEWRRETGKFMTLKMTESVCVSVAEGAGEGGEGEGGSSGAGSLSHTHSQPYPPPSNLAEKRGHGGVGCQPTERKTHRHTDRQLGGYRGQMGGEEEEQVEGDRSRLRTRGDLLWLWGLFVSVLVPPSGALVWGGASPWQMVAGSVESELEIV